MKNKANFSVSSLITRYYGKSDFACDYAGMRKHLASYNFAEVKSQSFDKLRTSSKMVTYSAEMARFAIPPY